MQPQEERHLLEPLDRGNELSNILKELKSSLTKVANITKYVDKSDGTGVRRIKIGRHYYQYRNLRYSITSKIMLCGRWLQESGFEYDEQVKIITMPDLLIIVPEQSFNPEQMANF